MRYEQNDPYTQPSTPCTQPTTPFTSTENSTPSTSRNRKSVSFTPSVQIVEYDDSFSQSEIIGGFTEMETITTPVKATLDSVSGTPVSCKSGGDEGTPRFTSPSDTPIPTSTPSYNENEMPEMNTLYKTRSVIGTPTKRGTPTPRPRITPMGGKSGDRIKAMEERIREMQNTPVRARRTLVEQEDKEN
jgi:hypothetical protein